MKRFHIVEAQNETLSRISSTYGVPLDVLRNINGIKNDNKLQIGQKIYLRKEDVLGVHALFLDADRNPISDQKYFLEFGGRIVKGVTGTDGLTEKIFTYNPSDEVKVLIERLDGSFKHIATVESGYRNKLVTILSPRCRADARTELDVCAGQGGLPQASERRKPIYEAGKRQPATTAKKDLGPEVGATTTVDKRPLTKVTGDVPDLDLFLDKYDGHELCDNDLRGAAAKLMCEPGVIYAIARQESSTSSFVKIGERLVPKILYERHWFKRLTTPDGLSKSPYQVKYHDICGPAYHRAVKNQKKELIDQKTGAIASADEIYGGGGLAQYKRLIKAYQLDPDAALKSCSWGKFQIMGVSYKQAGFESVREFVRAMSRSEAEHMKAFINLALTKPVLLSGLRHADFEKVAEGHNGRAWRTTNPDYAKNLKKYFMEYTNAHT
jgi:LysM repeat protein